MSTEAPTLEPPPSPSSEFQRAANAFDERLKVQQSEPSESDATPASEPSAKADTTDHSNDEIPEHLITGQEPPKPSTAKDDEIESIPAPAKMTQATAGNWGKLRTLAEQRGAELKRLQAELEAAKSAPKGDADPAVVESLKTYQQKAQELEAELERAAFERSSKFKELVGESNAAIASAKSYLDGAKTIEGEDVDPSIVDRAASVTGAKRLSVLKQAGLDPETIGAITASLADHDRASARRDQALNNHKELQSKWEQEQAAAQEQEALRIRQQEDEVFTKVISRLKATLPELQKVPGHDKWNAQVEQLERDSKEFFNGSLELDAVAELSVYAPAYKIATKRAEILAVKLKEANEKIARLSAAQPNGGSSSGTRQPTSTTSNDNSREAVAARFDAKIGR